MEISASKNNREMRFGPIIIASHILRNVKEVLRGETISGSDIAGRTSGKKRVDSGGVELVGYNEDEIIVDTPEKDEGGYKGGELLVVLDGVGGQGNGDVASKSAKEIIQKRIKAIPSNYSLKEARQYIDETIQLANIEVLKKQTETNSGCSAAIALAYVHKGQNGELRLIVAHLGDTRVYLHTKNKKIRSECLRIMGLDPEVNGRNESNLLPLTIDHGNYIKGESADGGFDRQKEYAEFTKQTDKVRLSLRRDIFSFIGLNIERITVPINDFPLSPDCKIALLSDGIHDNLTDSEIGVILDQDKSSAELVDDLFIATESVINDPSNVRNKPDDKSALVFRPLPKKERQKNDSKEVNKKILSVGDRVTIKNSQGHDELDWSVTSIDEFGVFVRKYGRDGSLGREKLIYPESAKKLVSPDIEKMVKKIRNLSELHSFVDSLSFIQYEGSTRSSLWLNEKIGEYVRNPNSKNYFNIPDIYGLREKVQQLLLVH